MLDPGGTPFGGTVWLVYMIDRVDFQIYPGGHDGTVSFAEPVMVRPGPRRVY